jgi:hypothetical protein
MLKNIIEIENKTWIKKNLKEEKKIVLVNSILVLVLVLVFFLILILHIKEKKEGKLYFGCLVLVGIVTTRLFKPKTTVNFIFFVLDTHRIGNRRTCSLHIINIQSIHQQQSTFHLKVNLT